MSVEERDNNFTFKGFMCLRLLHESVLIES